jgi:membrane protein implicated in regulation of membrane protease activity
MAEFSEMTDVELESQPTVANSSNPGVRPWVIIVIAVVLLALVTAAVYFLLQADAATTTKIRDIFIIFMALEFVVLGVALVILIIQLAKLVNLLENEVKPIIAATSETINTLKGTTEFLSENLVAPVIKLNSYMAGFKKVFDLLKIVRK